MKTFDTEKYFMAIHELNEFVPYAGCEYRNGCIARAFAHGTQEKLTVDRIRNMLLEDYEDGFIEYGQAVALNRIYEKVVEEMKRRWR